MKKTIFPRFSHDMSAAFDADPILIDGMKVLFDRIAGLVPVEMEKKAEKKVESIPRNEKSQNGKSN